MSRRYLAAALLIATQVVAFVPWLSAQQAETEKSRFIPANDPRIQIIGRYEEIKESGKIRLAYPGTGIRLRFHGKGVVLHFSGTDGNTVYESLDHDSNYLKDILLGGHELNRYVVNLEPADADHVLELWKQNETWRGVLIFEGVELIDNTELLAPPSRSARHLLFIGDSVTCGEGVNGNANCKEPERDFSSGRWEMIRPRYDAYHSYGMQLGRRLDAETKLVCYGGRGLVRDYRGLTAADNVLTVPQIADLAVPMDEPSERVKWEATKWQPDAIFISVGTNDFNLEKTKPLDETSWVGEYVKFLAHLRTEYPKAQIIVTEGAIVTDPLLAKMVKQAAEGAHDPMVHYVASKHYVGYACDAHPTGAEHRQMADDFEPVLRSTLGW